MPNGGGLVGDPEVDFELQRISARILVIEICDWQKIRINRSLLISLVQSVLEQVRYRIARDNVDYDSVELSDRLGSVCHESAKYHPDLRPFYGHKKLLDKIK